MMMMPVTPKSVGRRRRTSYGTFWARQPTYGGGKAFSMESIPTHLTLPLPSSIALFPWLLGQNGGRSTAIALMDVSNAKQPIFLGLIISQNSPRFKTLAISMLSLYFCLSRWWDSPPRPHLVPSGGNALGAGSWLESKPLKWNIFVHLHHNFEFNLSILWSTLASRPRKPWYNIWFSFFIDHFFLSMERQLICLNSWKSFFGRNSIPRNIIFTPWVVFR